MKFAHQTHAWTLAALALGGGVYGTVQFAHQSGSAPDACAPDPERAAQPAARACCVESTAEPIRERVCDAERIAATPTVAAPACASADDLLAGIDVDALRAEYSHGWHAVDKRYKLAHLVSATKSYLQPDASVSDAHEVVEQSVCALMDELGLAQHVEPGAAPVQWRAGADLSVGRNGALYWISFRDQPELEVVTRALRESPSRPLRSAVASADAPAETWLTPERDANIRRLLVDALACLKNGP